MGEGKMVFPDLLSEPSRTIITAEGGPSPLGLSMLLRRKKECLED